MIGAGRRAVLILVAVTGAIAAAALEKLRLSRALSQNVASIDQDRYFANGARTETLAMRSRSGTIRRIHSTHRLDKIQAYSEIDYQA